MLLWIKIAVFYGVPVLAIVLAIVYFAVLLRRVRRGAIARSSAAARYALTLLLPVLAVLIVWGTAEFASYLAVDRYVWDAAAAFDVLVSLLPIALYVGVPVALLVVTFWFFVSNVK